MNKYKGQHHFLLAVDCIIFGFDGKDIKLLLIQRGFEPEKSKWSLMGGFLEERYKKQISHEYHAEWFLVHNRPRLIFDHDEMVRLAQKQLRYKAAIQPLLFELLPET